MGIVASLGVRLFADLDTKEFERTANFVQDMVGQFVSASSHISDLSEKTSISATELQRFAYAGDLVGVSMDQIGSAATMLQKRLGSGSDGVQGAVAGLGLSFDHIKSLDPGMQFQVVATAIGKVEDATQRAALGSELLGRGWATILPLAKQDMQALGDEAELFGAVMGDRLVKAGDDAGDAWTKLTAVGKGLIAIPIASVVDRWNEAFRQAAQDTRDWAKTWEFVQTIANRGDAGKMPNLVGAPSGLLAPGLPGGMGAKEIAAIERELGSEMKKTNAEFDARMKKLKEFSAWLADGPIQWKEGLSSMPGQMLPWKMPAGPSFLPPMTSGVPSGLQASVFGFASPEEYAKAFTPPPGTFEKLAADMKMQAVPTFKDVALTGARSLIESLGQGIATGDWSGFKNSLMNSFVSFSTSAIAQGINLLIPGLGTLLQPLIGGLMGMIGGLFDRHKGRDSVVDFAASMGGFDALHAKLLQLGADGEALWVKLTQGTPSGNKDIAAANIQAVIDALNRQKVAGSAATDGLLSDLAAVPGAAGAAGLSIEELIRKYGELSSKYKNDWSYRNTGSGLPDGGMYSPGQNGGGMSGIRDPSKPIEIYDTNTGQTTTYSGTPADPNRRYFNGGLAQGAGSAPVINMTVNGSADKDFARRLLQAIGDGGSLYSLARGTLA